MSADLTALCAEVRRTRRTLDLRVGEARSIALGGQALARDITVLEHQIALHDKAAGLLTKIGEDRQHAAQKQIEALVTQGLQTIFGEELTFHLVPQVRGKRPEIDFLVRSRLDDGTIVDTDVMDARGGGLAATVGFLLRLVVLLLSRSRQETVLFLDETFAHVSADYEPRLAEFLRELVDKTGVQVVMVTHSDAFSESADTRYRFDLHDGVTRVRSL
jgi:DNA repair exonuclease SbcCD ATPase subunit